MPFIALAIVFGGAFFLKHRASVLSSQKAGQDAASGSAGVGAAGDIAKGAAGAAAIAVATVVGAEVGHEGAIKVAGADNGNAVDVAGTVGGAAIGATIAIAAIVGTTFFPVGICIIAAVLVAFLVIFVVDDINRLNRGQAGAAADFNDMWETIYGKAFKATRANPSYAALTDKEINRIVIPFVDGVAFELNRIKFLMWMMVAWKPGQSPLDHAFEGMVTARFCGQPRNNGGTNVTLDLDDSFIRSRRDNFADTYAPASEWKTVDGQRTVVVEDAPTANFAAGASASQVAKQNPITSVPRGKPATGKLGKLLDGV